MNVQLFANTNGKGHWATRVAEVEVVKIKLAGVHVDTENKGANNESFCEVRAYVDRTSWPVARDGLIYTDPQFIKDFRAGLVDLGVAPATARAVDYTEQGMQGRNFVSMGVYGRKRVEQMVECGFTIMQDPYNKYHGKEVEARKAKAAKAASKKTKVAR